ncbi:MAG TPA: hypothetical protein VF138_05685 [Caulobacteraceae bacterium]
MARVLVQCPVHDRPVFTGHRMTEAKLETDEGRYGFRCNICGQIHHWVKADARLESGGRSGA